MTDQAQDAPRVLYVRTEGNSSLPRVMRRQRELEGAAPRRVLIEEAFGFDLLGESDIAGIPGLRGAILRRLPTFMALALEVMRRRRDYEIVVSWAEKYSVAIAGILLLCRRRPLHVALMDWISKPIVRVPLRVVRGGIDRILTWSSVQGEFAIARIGFSPEQVRFIEHPVDDEFFAPMTADRTILFSAGETQRDFETLIDGVEGLAIPTVIAASRIGVFNGFRTRLADAQELSLPQGVTVESLDPTDLRRAYARAAVVVVPLTPAENNAGISVLLEAMSMARPVIVTRTEGQVDVVRDGENGLYVPAQDSRALRDAVERLLADPEYAERLGRAGRDDVVAKHRADDFAATVREAVHAMARQGGEISVE
ncbi:glycosyltransferase family 4 protein [Microbacterium sp. YMB-B2]|uniref:Glycosyltransferase family 4 protein n=1 Tax=Microbacterium tenebrionis TaxID=2830665 RepID=A0A9X1LPV2_9MICO|nr:glycosyltransferase family 4 protein [Microbacterium tenebrionis]MCC2029643.1 glycosyltransferase family 4 protein [Microbacterium tenebrionis]